MTLTEQWKKGELEQGEYWCKITESPYVERVYLPCCDDIIVGVLAPVPSYEEYLENESHCAVYSEVNKWLREENQQLKELLRECHSGFRKLPIYNLVGEDEAREVNKLLNKIDNAIGEKK